MRRLRVATRASRLARQQTGMVCSALRDLHPGLEIEEVLVRTTGDRNLHPDLAEMSRAAGIGFFVKEVEAALLERRADFAVHSLKDLPVEDTAGLGLAAVPARFDPRDGLAIADARERTSVGEDPLDLLPKGARVGTSSPRRRAQLLNRRPDLEVVPLRGNVPTRLEKAAGPDLDAAVLAMAGLERLDLGHEAVPFPPPILLPAAGQGALGVQCARDSEAIWELLSSLDDRKTRAAVSAERACLGRLQGGCALPVGVLAKAGDSGLVLTARLVSLSGEERLEVRFESDASDSITLGIQGAEELLAMGANRLLEG